MRDSVLEVSAGSVTNAERLESSSTRNWRITVRPDGDGDVFVMLQPGRACGEEGAVCTTDGRMLLTGIAVTIPGQSARSNTRATGLPVIAGTAPTPQVGETLTAVVTGIADANGLENAVFAYQWVSNDGTTDADIQGATRSTYALVDTDVGKTIKVRVTFTDDGGTEETLVSAATDGVVAAAPDASELSATFEDVPTEHDGSSTFTFTLSFSEEPEVSYKTLRDDAFDVTNGEVRKAQRQEQGKNQRWTITVGPESTAAVTITLPATEDCSATGAICTDDDRPLSSTSSRTVAGPADGPIVSVGDASATEGHDIEFTITLSKAIGEEVTVDYATADGTASGGSDFTTTSGTVTFAANETSRTVSVPTADDAADEEDETFTLTLTNPTNAMLDEATATGTIEDDDEPLPAVGVSDASATEGEAVEFTVSLSEASARQVTVQYATSGGTAASGTDFTETSGTLTFGANETSTTVSVPTADDSADEEDETFTLTLSSSGNATLGDAVATGTIEDDDEPPLTASFEGVPSEHAGSSVFTFRVQFSEEIPTSYTVLRDDGAFDVSGGTVRKARRVDGRDDLREIHVEPSGYGDVSISLPATNNCNAAGAICMDDGRRLSNSNSATVAGPVGISVADARVEEDEGAVLAFVVALSRAASGTVSVDYATSDGSAQAGVDYTAASDTLTFGSGESSKTIEVAVLDDAHDEGEETLSLTLSNVSAGRVTDGEATGTIENRDPLPRALLARFGRAAAMHVVEHVEERLEAPREPGFRGRVAGRELRNGMEREMALNLLNQLALSAGGSPLGGSGHGLMAGSPGVGAGGMGTLVTPGAGVGGIGPGGTPGFAGGASLGAGASTGAMAGTMGAVGLGASGLGAAAGPAGGLVGGGGLLRMGFGGGDLLTRSAFSMNRESRGGILSFWSRGARSHFAGREGDAGAERRCAHDDVRSRLRQGADGRRAVAVAQPGPRGVRGGGRRRGPLVGDGPLPVAGLQGDRPHHGMGCRRLRRRRPAADAGRRGRRLESGLSMAMAAAGTRGELVAGGAGGFELAFKADAMWVGTAIDGVDGPAGRLKATEAAVTRLRTGLEGSRDYTLAGRLSLTPSVEVGLRHDGGDADNGAGMDVGAGLVVSDAATGLAVDVRVRTLLVHQAEGFRERGVALSLSYNPTSSTPLGFTARVAPSWGGQAQGGAEALWGRDTMAGMAHGGLASGNRLDGEVGYGLPVGSRFVGTPRVGISTSEYGRDYRVGYGLGVLDRANVNFELGVDAHRRENPMFDGADNGFLGRATLGW